MKSSPENLPVQRKVCFAEAPKPAREERALASKAAKHEHDYEQEHE